VRMEAGCCLPEDKHVSTEGCDSYDQGVEEITGNVNAW
jgi:hypothetical protein